MTKKWVSAVKKTEVSADKYRKFITSLKAKIRSIQIKAAVAVNSELIQLYWEIGKEIVEKQKREGWGSKILEKLTEDLQNELEGFSITNLFRRKAFYNAYAKVPQAVGQFMSEVLTLGLPDETGQVVLLEPTLKVPDGGKLF